MHASKAAADGSLKGHQMSDALVMRQLVRVGAKRKAADNLDMRPFKIIARTLCEVNTGPEELLMEKDLILVSVIGQPVTK